MRFSIVIPLHNKAPYVCDTLQSIVDQTVLPFELILVDDKSTDGSLELATRFLQDVPERFKSVRIEIVALEENRGVSVARNLGFAKTSGEIISFIDADDLYAPELIQKATQLMETQEMDFVVLGIQLFPGGIRYPDFPKIVPGLQEVETDAYLMKHPLKTVTSRHFVMGVGSNVIARRKWMETVHFDETARFYEGIDFWYRVLKVVLSGQNPKVGMLMGNLLRVREVDGSLSRKKYHSYKELTLPPVLVRYKNSRDRYDKLLMGVVGARWISHAFENLNSRQQKIRFMIRYAGLFPRQLYYLVLRRTD
ncbi:glycosyltransferase family 2 protein [Fluviicola sp.]|uniref:glycosyltransferase family 2 protein n=1 Tax=Fluviicola sp. TaxID=1917219 RepID=UPI002613C034|nr:glycosyltransferase family 2 protein [Fluviicola sp.]